MNTAELTGLIDYSNDNNRQRLQNLIEKVEAGCVPTQDEEDFVQRLRQLKKLFDFERNSTEEERLQFQTIQMLKDVIPKGEVKVGGRVYNDYRYMREISRHFDSGQPLTNLEAKHVKQMAEKYQVEEVAR